MTNGWIKLHRTLLDKAVFMNPYALQVFLYCLMKATYKDMKLAVGNQTIFLKPGQLLYGRKRVSQRLGMGEGKLRGIMEYLEQNGTIQVVSHSRYSVVTITNWEQYQNGEGVPNIPFDCDFFEDALEEAYPVKEEVPAYTAEETNVPNDKAEPAYSQPESQSATEFAESACKISASREPQYNNIKNKIKENNIKQNKTEEKTSENLENIQNIENMNPFCHYRQISGALDDCASQKGSRGYTSQDEYPSAGEPFTKGKGEILSAGEPVPMSMPQDADDYAEAFASLSMLDAAALDAYFASCDYAQFDAVPTVIPSEVAESYQEFPAEMVYSLTEEEAARIEAMFAQPSAFTSSDSSVIPTEAEGVYQNFSASSLQGCTRNDIAASIDEIDPYEQNYIAAHQLFEHLWKMYPVKIGKEKVSEAQIMYLYEEVGEKAMKRAIWRYQDKKHRVPKKYWQNGSTFFNGGYEDYLPEITACAESCAE